MQPTQPTSTSSTNASGNVAQQENQSVKDDAVIYLRKDSAESHIAQHNHQPVAHKQCVSEKFVSRNTSTLLNNIQATAQESSKHSVSERENTDITSPASQTNSTGAEKPGYKKKYALQRRLGISNAYRNAPLTIKAFDKAVRSLLDNKATTNTFIENIIDALYQLENSFLVAPHKCALSHPSITETLEAYLQKIYRDQQEENNNSIENYMLNIKHFLEKTIQSKKFIAINTHITVKDLFSKNPYDNSRTKILIKPNEKMVIDQCIKKIVDQRSKGIELDEKASINAMIEFFKNEAFAYGNLLISDDQFAEQFYSMLHPEKTADKEVGKQFPNISYEQLCDNSLQLIIDISIDNDLSVLASIPYKVDNHRIGVVASVASSDCGFFHLRSFYLDDRDSDGMWRVLSTNDYENTQATSNSAINHKTLLSPVLQAFLNRWSCMLPIHELPSHTETHPTLSITSSESIFYGISPDDNGKEFNEAVRSFVVEPDMSQEGIQLIKSSPLQDYKGETNRSLYQFKLAANDKNTRAACTVDLHVVKETGKDTILQITVSYPDDPASEFGTKMNYLSIDAEYQKKLNRCLLNIINNAENP